MLLSPTDDGALGVRGLRERVRRFLPNRALLSQAPVAFAGLGAAAVMVTAIGLLRTKVLTNALRPEQYGTLSYALALFLTVLGVVNLGLGTGLRRRLALGQEEPQLLLGTALSASLTAGAITLGVGTALALGYGDAIVRDPDGTVVLAAVLAGVPLALLDTLWLDALYAADRRKAAASYLLVFRSFAVATVVVGALLAGLQGAAVGFTLGFVPSALWGFARRGLQARPRFSRRALGTLLRDGGVNQTIIASNLLTGFVVRSLVISHLGKVPLALYAVALAVSVPLSQFIGAGLSGTFFNEFGRGGPEARLLAIQTHRRIVEAVAVVVVPLGVLLLPLGLQILTSADYSSAVHAGRLLLLAAAIEGLFFIEGNALFIADRIRWYVVVQNAGNLVLVAVAAVVVGSGIAWVAAASIVAQAFQFGFARISVNRMYPGVAPPAPLVLVALVLAVGASTAVGPAPYLLAAAGAFVGAWHLGRVVQSRRRLRLA